MVTEGKYGGGCMGYCEKECGGTVGQETIEGV
jgi:hypothetical protein